MLEGLAKQDLYKFKLVNIIKTAFVLNRTKPSSESKPCTKFHGRVTNQFVKHDRNEHDFIDCGH